MRTAERGLSKEGAEHGKHPGGLEKQDGHHDRSDVTDHKGVKGLAAEGVAAGLHFLNNPLGLDDPAHQYAGEQRDKGHEETVADIVHQVQQLGGLSIGQGR